MKSLLFTAFIIGISLACNAQEKNSHNSKVVFTPPVIVKDEKAKTSSKEVVKFTPPVIVKDKSVSTRKKQESEAVKFTPPVIVKDAEKKH